MSVRRLPKRIVVGNLEVAVRRGWGCCLLFISHCLIRYESSRGHKIDGTKLNQTGNTSGEKQGKQAEGEGNWEGERADLSYAERLSCVWHSRVVD